jgi:anti-sigma regulatory factor (Ser/Thr protein kinase)
VRENRGLWGIQWAKQLPAMSNFEDSATPAALATFRHEALLYEGDDGFLAGTAPFIRAAVEAEEPVLTVVSAPKIDMLREELGDVADEATFADMQDVGSNPARIIPAWREFVEENGGGKRPLRGIGEPIWADRRPAELVECQRHEALLNLVFADGTPMWLMCPYDSEALGPEVIAEAHCSHPVVVEEGKPRASDGYHDIDVVAGPFAAPLSPPPADAADLSFTADTLDSLRVYVGGAAELLGLEPARCADLVLAVNEVATNAVLHGGGEGTLLMWAEDGTVMCEVRDSGMLDAPLAGRVRPSPDRVGGHGLWLANHVCDLVQMRSFPDGTVVRVHVRAG